jgi:hypothetical protein
MMARTCAVMLILGALSLGVMRIPPDNAFLSLALAHAGESWKKEFDDICAKTQDAMVFEQEELRSLIQRCDGLKPLIEKLNETQRKVYLKRLQMCRDLFSFVLESKEKK